MDLAALQKAVNDSGFPLQLGVKRLAESTNKWRVHALEHPWQDPLSSGALKFIDIILNGRLEREARSGLQTLIVECKRARDAAWIFLRDTGERKDNHRLVTRSFVIAKREGIQHPLICDWADVQCTPGSPIASFCVVRHKESQGERELLERTAAELVRATNAIAQEELTIAENLGELKRVYTPVLVTNAKLHICDADYRNVNLQSGEVADARIVEVPFLRFTKSLSASRLGRSITTLEEASDASERTVIVVRADSFLDFLTHWELADLNAEIAGPLFK